MKVSFYILQGVYVLDIERAIKVQSSNVNDLMRMNNVVGVAVGNKTRRGESLDNEAVVVLVNRKLPISALSAEDILPQSIDGVAIDVIEIGYPRAYIDPTDKFVPPIPAGISVGHYQITAGTLGAIVKDKNSEDLLLLSNNHIFANSNHADIRDNILQPGPYDGGSQSDSIAWLERFVPLKYIGDQAESFSESYGLAEGIRDFGNKILSLVNSDKRLYVESLSDNPPPDPEYNLVDAAVARPYRPEDFSEAVVLNIGKITGTKAPYINQQVRKMGRTTGHTEGYVQLLNAVVDVSYGNDGVARFQNQIIIGSNGVSFSQGGDSGSLIVDKDENKAVGLLFAGSETTTIANPIDLVLQELSITI